MLPLDTVSDEGFLCMYGKRIRTKVQPPRLYQQQLDEVKSSLSDSRYSTSFAMTTDIWSSRANDSYIALYY